MSVDFTKPIATADRAQNLTDTRDTLVATAKLLDDTTPTGVATGMIRWSSTNNKFQKYNGSSWVDLASTFAINVSSFNGQAASYYTNITARLGYTPVNKAGDTMTGPLVLNADPSATLGAATKGYVDTGLSGKAAAAHTHAWSSITDRLFEDGPLTENPNTTTYPAILTNHANAPSTASYWHILTLFRSSSDKAQLAIENTGTTPKVYARQCNTGTWSQWIRCDLGEGLTRSIGASGYAKIPGAGGLMIQWGITGSIVYYGALTVTLPIAFPTACVAVMPALVNSTISSTTGGSVAVSSMTATNFTLRNMHDSSSAVLWVALGY